jgi:hypothetical protein
LQGAILAAASAPQAFLLDHGKHGKHGKGAQMAGTRLSVFSVFSVVKDNACGARHACE